MPFGPVVFNQLASVWVAPATPSGGAATTTNIPCQLYLNPLSERLYDAAIANPWSMTIVLKVAVGAVAFKRANIWECPQGSGLYYYTVFCETFFRSFGSQFDGWLVFQCNANGSIPRTY